MVPLYPANVSLQLSFCEPLGLARIKLAGHDRRMLQYLYRNERFVVSMTNSSRPFTEGLEPHRVLLHRRSLWRSWGQVRVTTDSL